jgi:hypothetical protein
MAATGRRQGDAPEPAAPAAALSFSAAASPAAPSRVRLGALPLLLLGIGVLLRVAQYLANRSLWLDEAYLAPTILHRSFAGLLRPPDYGQIVPVGFLVLERAAVAIFGDSEYALRLIPLAAGLASLFLFRRVAGRSLPQEAATLALALFVFSDSLIWFSSELKQYSLDVLIALLLLDCALAALEDPKKRGPILALAILGVAAVWFSLPAIFVLAGIGAAQVVSALVRKDPPRATAVVGAAVLWAASFAILNAVSLSKIGRAPIVLDFWSRAFWPLPPRTFEEFYWLPKVFGAVFGDPVGFVFRGLGIFCFLVGCLAVGSPKRGVRALLLSPMLVTLIASGLKRYPFSGRLLLFLVPSILLLVAAGANAIREIAATRSAAIGRILVALLLFHPVLFAARGLIHPRTREELWPVLQYMKRHRLPGDRLYLYDGASPAFDYYAPRLGGEAAVTVRGTFGGLAGDPRPDAERLRGGGRTWVVFSHAQRGDGADDERRLLELLDRTGTRLEAFRAPGAAVYLYDMGERDGVNSGAGTSPPGASPN